MVEPTPTVCCGCDILKTNTVLVGIEIVLYILGMITVFVGKTGQLKFFEGPTGILTLIFLGLELYGTIKKKPGFIMASCGWRIFKILINIILLILVVLVWKGTVSGIDLGSEGGQAFK